MVEEEIFLGHTISSKGIEMDRAKTEIIEKLSPPISLKGVRGFLGHANFYRCLIKDFSLISKSLTNLLIKDVLFVFDDTCLSVFNRLKETLVSTPIITPPN